MVNSAPGFDRQPAVINGFSDLILELFGPEVGAHARSAVGMAELPFGIPVEIEGEVEIRSRLSSLAASSGDCGLQAERVRALEAVGEQWPAGEELAEDLVFVVQDTAAVVVGLPDDEDAAVGRVGGEGRVDGRMKLELPFGPMSLTRRSLGPTSAPVAPSIACRWISRSP